MEPLVQGLERSEGANPRYGDRQQKAGQLKVKKLIKAYLAHVRANHAPGTHRSYEGCLKRFAREFGSRDIRKLKASEVLQWLDEVTKLNGEPLAPDSKRLQIVAVERLQKFAVKIGELRKPIVVNIPKPRGRRRERIATLEETKVILRHAPSREWRLIYRALRTCGARPNELCRARIADIDWGDNVIRLKEHKTAEKTGEDRQIGIGMRMRRFVLRSIGERTEGRIFLDERGQSWRVPRLSRIFRGIRNELGLPKQIVLYCTRHECGTRVCEEYGIHAAAETLGHRQIQTTQRYVHPDKSKIGSYQEAVR